MGQTLTTAQVAYMQGKSLADMDKSDIDLLLEHFRDSDDVSYQVLWDCPYTTEDVLVQQCKFGKAAPPTSHESGITSPPTSGPTTTPHPVPGNAHKSPATGLRSTYRHAGSTNEGFFDLAKSPDFAALQEDTAEHRRLAAINDKTKIFCCLAWSLKDEIRLFKLFPEVVHLDCTCATNMSKNHLLTFTARTSTLKQFIFLRVWIYNQRRATFRWVFQSVLPNLLPESFLNRINLFMVDGDAQQNAELQACCTAYARNAGIGQCGWHILYSPSGMVPQVSESSSG